MFFHWLLFMFFDWFWLLFYHRFLDGLLDGLLHRFLLMLYRIHRWNIDLEHAGARALRVISLVDEAELESKRSAMLLEVLRPHDASR